MPKNILLALRPNDQICAGPLCLGLNNPGSVAGTVLGKLVTILLIIGGLLLLLFLLWGGLDWLLSAGDKEKIAKAQQKLTNAVIGMIILAISWTLWGFITGDVLGLIKKQNGRWTLTLPQF